MLKFMVFHAAKPCFICVYFNVIIAYLLWQTCTDNNTIVSEKKKRKTYRGLIGGFLLLWIFSVAICVSPKVCFILDLILISMFLR